MNNYIEFNGEKSKDFGMKLENKISFQSPSRSLTFQKIDGKDGEILVGDDSLNNTKLSYPFTIHSHEGKKIDELATSISNWLKKDGNWHELYFTGDPEYIYIASFLDEYTINRTISTYGKCTLTFNIKPYKFLKEGLHKINLTNELVNPTNRNAKPKIYIKANGNITLEIGREVLNLKDLQGGIVVDSLLQTATTLDGTRAAWDKISSYPLPVIVPGKNLINILGDVEEIKIIPRWEVIV
ncbi:distal tail protein Dit [Floricoccus penangensis]|uniref:distal tail protein Dit n=1 Tax=Floricoccus penangensis TaxID=1859475 RepID=UPI0020402AEB|nr:distal tail protein Dit [Floricoccus penangensis]URZ87557.1 phage tail family protein [Floricoccus penangensis]